MRSLFALFALVLAPLVAPAAAPPACVSVWLPTDPAGVTVGGSGTVIACEDGKSLVVTNNHVLSPGRDASGRFATPAPGTACTVKCAGKSHPGTVLAASQDLDLCAVVVAADLPAAPLAPADARLGAKVTRHGIGSGEQPGTVVEPDARYVSPSMFFTVEGKSESGDSGSAYFNERGEVVAVHAGKNGVGNPRGVPVSYVRVWVREVSGPRFPRLAKLLDGVKALWSRLWNRSQWVEVVPPAAVPGPVPKELPKVVNPPKKVEPVPVPAVQYRLVTYHGRFGRTWSQWEPVAPGCPGGVCPLPKGK